MNLAFIASTLPAWFLKKNIKTLKIDMFIFLNEDIFKIYDSFLTLNNKFYLFNETIKNEENRKKIYNFENTFLIFHECCWDKLDKIIINDKIETTFYPISSLKGWVDLDKSGLFNIFVKYGFSFTTLKSYLKYLFLSRLESRGFKYHFAPMETDKSSFILTKSLRHDYIKNVKLNMEGFGFKGSGGNTKRSKKIILLISSDVISSKKLMPFFNYIIIFCEKNNIDYAVKFHPFLEKSIINQFELDEKNILDKSMPFEVSGIDYKYKISLFSTALIFEPEKSISIEKILEKNISEEISNNKKFDLRKNHLRSFENFHKIFSPNDLNDLYNLIK